MSAGLWNRMREALLVAGMPLTPRDLAERCHALEELPTVRNILYLTRKHGAHVERVAPAQPGGEYRWRLLRDARVQRSRPSRIQRRA